jgi:bifunctional non-homologous end joining protein LigD
MTPAVVSVRAGRRSVRLTHPDKLLFPGDGITKADLAVYLRAVAPTMVPHIRDRPVTLHRFNNGIAGPGFMQKEIPRGAPEWVRRVRVPKEGGTVCHALANDAATLVWLANVNCLTAHVWTSRADRLERPDRLVVDLDPEDDDDFPVVVRAALDLRSLLVDAGTTPFTMTTGSRGLHVVVALRRRHGFDAVLAAATALAEALVARAPDERTTAFRKAERGGRLYVDVLRNRWAQTVVAPYAVRARPHAPVAMPVRWEELEEGAVRRASQWPLRAALERLERAGDAWEDITRSAGPLPRFDAIRSR